MSRSFFALALLLLSMIAPGCGSQKSGEPQKKGAPVPATTAMMAENRKHPLGKHIELVGFRLSEKGQGKLNVQVGVVNHSNADIADLGLDVTLRPATASADDPAFCTFTLKLPSLGPREMKDAVAECPTTLRIYELPDWQFIRATFQITSPNL